MEVLINALVLWSVYVLFSLGLSLAWGTLNVLNLAHGAIFMFSGFAGHLLSQQLGAPYAILVLSSMFVGGLLSVAMEVLVFRPIRRKVPDAKQAELLMLIGSLGASSVLVSVAQRRTDDSPFGLDSSSAINVRVLDWGIPVTNVQLLMVLCGVVLSGALGVWILRGRAGKALRAIAYDAETAQVMGVNPGTLAIATMFLAGALAGLAGMLLMAHVGALSPTSGESLLLKGFAMVILGGIGSVSGTVVGAGILAIAETAVLELTDGSWVDAASFAVIILVILVRPEGIFPAARVDRV